MYRKELTTLFLYICEVFVLTKQRSYASCVVKSWHIYKSVAHEFTSPYQTTAWLGCCQTVEADWTRDSRN